MYWLLTIVICVALFLLDLWVTGRPDEGFGARSPHDEVTIGEETFRAVNNREAATTA